jgi:hypothetical protein
MYPKFQIEFHKIMRQWVSINEVEFLSNFNGVHLHRHITKSTIYDKIFY